MGAQSSEIVIEIQGTQRMICRKKKLRFLGTTGHQVLLDQSPARLMELCRVLNNSQWPAEFTSYFT